MIMDVVIVVIRFVGGVTNWSLLVMRTRNLLVMLPSILRLTVVVKIAECLCVYVRMNLNGM